MEVQGWEAQGWEGHAPAVSLVEFSERGHAPFPTTR